MNIRAHAAVRCALALLACLQHADSARVLGLFPHTGRSHQMVFEPLLQALAGRGHHVTVVSFFPLKNPPPNYTDVTLEGIAPIGLETFDIRWVESNLPSFFGIERVIETIMGFHPLEPMALGICEKLLDLPSLADALRKEYDVVLVENFNSDCMLGLAHVYGVRAPRVALLSSNMMAWSAHRLGIIDHPAHVPVTGMEFGFQMSLYERVLNTLVFGYMNYWYRGLQAKEQEMIEARFGRRVDLGALGRNMSASLVNVAHDLTGVRPGAPALLEVGGMHLDPRRRPIPQYMERFLNESAEGVVLFSWGSLIKTASLPAEKEAVLVRVLSALPQRVIWKWEGSGPEGNLSGNILRVNWLPQYDLLRHKKVLAFVAHGGLLGMTEAVSAGKPMLVVPFFGDQPGNAAAAERAGLATVVRYSELTEESFGQALRKTLSAEMRLSARQLSKMWKDRPMDPLDTAVYWVERVARWGHASALHSPARDLSFVQLALLDVIGVILLAIVTVCALIWLLVKTALGFVCQSPKAKKKVH